eukprot:14292545-Ditylum_brightwellii.AAC.1
MHKEGFHNEVSMVKKDLTFGSNAPITSFIQLEILDNIRRSITKANICEGVVGKVDVVDAGSIAQKL